MTKTKEPTVAEILASVQRPKTRSKLTEWLEANPKRTKRFWAVIDQGHAEGLGLQPLIAAWNAKHSGPDLCPVKDNQVRMHLVDRQEKRGKRA